MTRYIRLSYPITKDMPLYPGLEPVVLEPKRSIAGGDTSNSFRFTMSNHAGTHVDAPRHFAGKGRAISEYGMDELIFSKPLVLDCPKQPGQRIDARDIEKALPGDCDILLIRTHFSRWRVACKTRYAEENPFLDPSAAKLIREGFAAIKAIGIDTISIASATDRERGRESHRILLKDDSFGTGPVLIVEDMMIPEGLSRLKSVIVLPVMVEGLDSAPCAVLGVIDD
ncbi:MAG: cyclase family protein [Candidatus Omnitrophica bacterium]|nr:cyclase family protein [Candidatus Omnitrophota bacterium]